MGFSSFSYDVVKSQPSQIEPITGSRFHLKTYTDE